MKNINTIIAFEIEEEVAEVAVAFVVDSDEALDALFAAWGMEGE